MQSAADSPLVVGVKRRVAPTRSTIGRGRGNQAPGGCKQAIKTLQAEIDPGLEVKVESVHIAGTTATAKVKSTFEGKRRLSTLEFVKQGGRWKVSGIQ